MRCSALRFWTEKHKRSQHKFKICFFSHLIYLMTEIAMLIILYAFIQVHSNSFTRTNENQGKLNFLLIVHTFIILSKNGDQTSNFRTADCVFSQKRACACAC